MVGQEVTDKSQYGEDVVHCTQYVHQGVVQVRFCNVWFWTETQGKGCCNYGALKTLCAYKSHAV